MSTILPRSVLRKLCGASVISFSRKCGASPRSMSRVVTWAVTTSLSANRQVAAVVGHPADARQLAGPGAFQHEHLAAAARGRHGLAVDAQEVGRLLDHAVGLAGDDEHVVAEADVQRLAAAAQGEEHLVGRLRSLRGDGDAALELGHRAAEGLRQRHPPAGVQRHHRRDDLGVGGDRAGDAQAVVHLDVGVVVDVAVQHGHGVRAGRAVRGRLHLATAPHTTARSAPHTTARSARCSPGGSWAR